MNLSKEAIKEILYWVAGIWLFITAGLFDTLLLLGVRLIWVIVICISPYRKSRLMDMQYPPQAQFYWVASVLALLAGCADEKQYNSSLVACDSYLVPKARVNREFIP